MDGHTRGDQSRTRPPELTPLSIENASFVLISWSTVTPELAHSS